MTWPTQQGIYDAGDITLQSGARLPSARLSWKAHGTLSPRPRQRHRLSHQLWRAASGPGVADRPGQDPGPDRWFIVIPDMFGNGLSSSPSDTAGLSRRWSPSTTTSRCSAGRLADLFGIDHVACVYGWSMGALQAYHWAALFPDAVERIVVNCGVARTAVHNQVFLRSLMATLEAAPQHIGNGRFSGRTARREARLRADLRRLGAQPGFLSRRPAPRRRSDAQPGRARPGDVPEDRLGGPLRRPSGRQPVCPASHLGCRRHQRQRPVRRRPRAPRCARSGRGCC